MNINDILWLSYKDLKEKKVRTALTAVMVVIGIAAIVALTSVTAGLNQSISAQLSALGPTSIIVSSDSATGFSVADVATISSLPNVTSVTPLISGSANLYEGSQNVSVTVIGVTTQGLKQLLGGNVSMYEGTLYSDSVSPEAVLGHSVAFPSSAAGAQATTIGQSATLKIATRGGGTVAVPIVGILASHGGFIIPVDSAVFVPLPAAQVLLHRSAFNEMLVLASNVSSVNATGSLITTIYGSSARVVTTASLLSTVSTILGSLGLLFGAIAGVSLLVAAIGIMNIMLIAVYERIHEIGIMKSVGFKNADVMTIFLSQALLIGIIGGIVGILLGASASYGLAAAFSHSNSASGSTQTQRGSQAAFVGGAPRGGFTRGSQSSTSSLAFHPVFPVETILAALFVSMVVSVIAGLYPAWRASNMEPIDALRQL